jgi:hypothetical protein
MSASDRRNPHGCHRFEVDLGTGDTLGFTAVRGLSVSAEIRPQDGPDEPEDNDPDPWWSVGDWVDLDREDLPGPTRRRTQSPPLELRRGLTVDTTLWEWLQEWVAGTTKPRDVHVVLKDTSQQPVRAWRCPRATPVEWTGPKLIATRSQVAMETVTLAHDGIEHVADPSRWSNE